VVASAIDLADEPHAFGKIVAHAPEIDDVAAAPQARRMFDDDRSKPGRLEPKGEGRAANARPGDQHRLL